MPPEEYLAFLLGQEHGFRWGLFVGAIVGIIAGVLITWLT